MSIARNVGLNALLTARATLDTVGHNISNANTPGFSRQGVDLSAAPVQLLRGLGIGGGVSADLVRRTTDELLTRRLVDQSSSLSRLESRLTGLAEVEALLGEPGGFGIGQRMSDFFASVSALSSSPDDLVLRTGMAQSGVTLTGQFRQLAAGLDTVGRDARGQVRSQVDEVNRLADQVVLLNGQISELEASRVPANDLRDQRDLVLRELGARVDVRYVEDKSGAVQVFAANRLLVGRARAYEVSSVDLPGGRIELQVEGASAPLEPRSGSLAGLLEVARASVPELRADLDRLARELAFALNRAHSTGLPAGGPFTQLTAEHALGDADGDGQVVDELLNSAGLPFEVQDGELWVNITDEETGELSSTAIAIDTGRTTVGDLVAALDAVPHLSASLDASGRLQLLAEAGYGFDFSRRLDALPDDAGSFGGARASLASAAAGPFALADGQTLDLVGALGPVSIAISAADFADVTRATAEELAAVIRADPNAQAGGLVAEAVDGRLVLQSSSEGPGASFQVAGGGAAAALGWAPGTTVAGHATAVAVEVGGSYTGAENRAFTFTPVGDGTVGVTPGLAVEVHDASGALVTTLDLGPGYDPGTPLDVVDGLTATFHAGSLEASANDFFVLEARADSDTSDALVALGLNPFLVGTGAADLAVRKDIVDDPSRIATSLDGTAAGNGALLDYLRLESQGLAALGGATLGEFYGDVVGGVGFEVAAVESALEVERFLTDSLEQRREQVSGVNVDEELVKMIQFEQAFASAAQFLQVVNGLEDELLNLL